jgi:uncharacterized membrane protein YbjE (DUF340 family)
LSKLVVICVCLGLLLGWLSDGGLKIPNGVEFAAFSAMLFGVGLELGQDQTVWHRLRRGGWKMFLFPINVVVGSWIGGAFAGIILGLSVHVAIAVASGFGWYSLAAVLMNQLNGPELAAVAFISNILREFLSFLFIPWLARFGQGAVAVAISGATGMDTTLPLIARYTNRQAALYAFVSGVTASLLVPVFIPLWMQL